MKNMSVCAQDIGTTKMIAAIHGLMVKESEYSLFASIKQSLTQSFLIFFLLHSKRLPLIHCAPPKRQRGDWLRVCRLAILQESAERHSQKFSQFKFHTLGILLALRLGLIVRLDLGLGFGVYCRFSLLVLTECHSEFDEIASTKPNDFSLHPIQVSII